MGRALIAVLLLAGGARGAVVEVPYLFFPQGVGSPMYYNGGAQSADMLANQMRCESTVPAVSITNATKLGMEIFGDVGQICGSAIYTADGNTQIATTGAQTCGQVHSVVVTVPAFSIAAGTQYVYCWSTNTPGYPQRFGTLNFWMFINDTLPGTMGNAANAAPGGAPPATTGALTPWASLPSPNREGVYLFIAK